MRYLSLLLLSVTLMAQCWQAEGAYLYWRPCGPSVVRDGELIKTSYESGYRVGMRFLASGAYLAARYWSVDAEINYDSADLQIGLALGEAAGSCLWAFVGGRYVYMRDTRFNPSIRMTGGGVEAGIMADWLLCGCLSFVGQATTFVGLGEQTTRPFPSETACIPGFDLSGGFRYKCCLCGAMASVELGYEMDYLFDALRLTTCCGDLTRASAGFHGLYAQLALQF